MTPPSDTSAAEVYLQLKKLEKVLLKLCSILNIVYVAPRHVCLRVPDRELSLSTKVLPRTPGANLTGITPVPGTSY